MPQKTTAGLREISFIVVFDLKQRSQNLSNHVRKAGGAESQTHSQCYKPSVSDHSATFASQV